MNLQLKVQESPEYMEFVATLQRSIDELLPDEGPVFTTNASGLFKVYLMNLSPNNRQEHNCHTCRRFFEKYGGLVTICKETGFQTPLLWSKNHYYGINYDQAVQVLREIVKSAMITGVFYDDKKEWGIKEAGGRGHFIVYPKPFMIFKDKLKTPEEAMAEKLEDCSMLSRTLNIYKLKDIQEAYDILASDILYRSDKVIGPMKWFLDLKKQMKPSVTISQRNNLIWRAAATAPPGFCHVRSSMAGSLLEDLEQGYPLEDVKRRFAAKMQPDQYLRPQAPASAGNAIQGEKIIKKLGCTLSLSRRYLQLDEVKYLRKFRKLPPPFRKRRPTGVFKDVVSEPRMAPESSRIGDPSKGFQTVNITWRKFRETFLPQVTQMEVFIRSQKYAFIALTTAVYADAPPILKWDSEEKRNPVSSYVYTYGSYPGSWGLKGETFVEVIGICFNPECWQKEQENKSIIFLLKDAEDSGSDSCGLALFPENLISELHSIRSTIEKFSKGGKLKKVDSPACGVCFGDGNWNILLRVKLLNYVRDFIIDRFD
jgi:hypothetical protein